MVCNVIYGIVWYAMLYMVWYGIVWYAMYCSGQSFSRPGVNNPSCQTQGGGAGAGTGQEATYPGHHLLHILRNILLHHLLHHLVHLLSHLFLHHLIHLLLVHLVQDVFEEAVLLEGQNDQGNEWQVWNMCQLSSWCWGFQGSLVFFCVFRNLRVSQYFGATSMSDDVVCFQKPKLSHSWKLEIPKKVKKRPPTWRELNGITVEWEVGIVSSSWVGRSTILCRPFYIGVPLFVPPDPDPPMWCQLKSPHWHVWVGGLV